MCSGIPVILYACLQCLLCSIDKFYDGGTILQVCYINISY